MTDKTPQQNPTEFGFESAEEVRAMMKQVNINDPFIRNAFVMWQANDKTKEGLEKIIVDNNTSTFKVDGPVIIRHHAPIQMTIQEVILQLEEFNNITAAFGKVFVKLAFQDDKDPTHHYCDDARTVGTYRYNQSKSTVVSSEHRGRSYVDGLTIGTLIEALDGMEPKDEVLDMYSGDADMLQQVNHVSLFTFTSFDEEDSEWREGAICYLVGVRAGMSL